MLSITLTATLTLDCKTISTWFSFSFWSIALFILFFFDSEILLDEQYLKVQLKKKENTNSRDVLFHSVYQLYAHVLCMFPQ